MQRKDAQESAEFDYSCTREESEETRAQNQPHRLAQRSDFSPFRRSMVSRRFENTHPSEERVWLCRDTSDAATDARDRSSRCIKRLIANHSFDSCCRENSAMPRPLITSRIRARKGNGLAQITAMRGRTTERNPGINIF